MMMTGVTLKDTAANMGRCNQRRKGKGKGPDTKCNQGEELGEEGEPFLDA